MWSRPPLPSSATAASYVDVDSYHNPSGSPPALGAANTINSADAASDDDGGNGWMFTHSSVVGQINDHHFLQLFALRLDASIRDE